MILTEYDVCVRNSFISFGYPNTCLELGMVWYVVGKISACYKIPKGDCRYLLLSKLLTSCWEGGLSSNAMRITPSSSYADSIKSIIRMLLRLQTKEQLLKEDEQTGAHRPKEFTKQRMSGRASQGFWLDVAGFYPLTFVATE